MVPPKVPASTVRTVVPRAIAPPSRALTDAVAPLRLAVPDVSVAIVAAPPTVSVPPLNVVTSAAPATVVAPPVTAEAVREPAETAPPAMAEVSRPATSTAPPAMPPRIVAALAKRVAPAPARDVRVIVPVRPEKSRLAAAALALVTAPVRVSPVPETVAEPRPPTSREAAAL